MRFVLPVCALLVLTGCASVPTAPPEVAADVKRITPKAGVGQVYICRDDTVFGMGIRPDVELNGRIVATIPRSSFSYHEVPPGDHVVSMKSLEHTSRFPFKIAAGEQKFFQTWITFGVIAGRAIIDEMPADKARDCIAKGELVGAVR